VLLLLLVTRSKGRGGGGGGGGGIGAVAGTYNFLGNVFMVFLGPPCDKKISKTNGIRFFAFFSSFFFDMDFFFKFGVVFLNTSCYETPKISIKVVRFLMRQVGT
jgi:hypothetical protein